MDSKDNERVLLLEEEVRSLSEELAQCQADKEFVWSLWKRLQVASPDLTQAVSLVVEREKQKAENKDRKVLEILQAKDYRIQELEQISHGLITHSGPNWNLLNTTPSWLRRHDSIINARPKVTAQEQEINNRVQQLRGSEEECGLMKKELAALQHRLGNKSRQLKEARRQAQECEEEGRRALQEARQQLDAQHSASQAELERLRDQEAVSSSRVKNLEEELFRSRQDVLEAQSRSTALSLQLSTVEREGADKEQQLCQIKHELQDLQCLYKQSVEHAGEQAQLIQQLEGLNLDTQRVLRSQEEAHTADTVSYQKLHSELSVSYQALWHSQEQLRQREAALSMQLSQRDQQIQELQAQLQSFTAAAGHCEGSGSVSPGGGSSDGADSQEQRIQQLQELLALKTKENEDLRRAHAKHHNRLRIIQTNYRTVTERLKEAEDAHDLLKCKTQVQQDSEDLWNELVFYKEENKKLLSDKESGCQVTVWVFIPSAELLFREVREDEVRRSSTPIKTTARRVEQTFKKIEQLQSQMVSLESEIMRLREDNRALQQANGVLAGVRGDLQARVQLLQERKEAAEAQAGEERDRLLAQMQSFERQAKEAMRAAAQARHRLLKLRQELGVLRAERDFHRSAAKRRSKAATLANNKSRSKTPWVDASSRTRMRSTLNRMDSPAKDDWEDMSADSDSEEFSDSLESRYSAQTRRASRKTKGCRYMLICPTDRPGEESQTRNIQFQGASLQKIRKKRISKSHAVLQQRLLSLQQQVTALQAGKQAAQQLAAEQNHKHVQTQVQLDSLLQQLNASKQLSKKQACELAGLEQQKTSLQMELEQWRRIRQQTSMNPPAIDTECLQAQVKQLTHRLKNASSEMSKHTAANKSLRAQLDERDQTLKELHERVGVLERDVTMKRQLVEDLRCRLKICQESEKSLRAVTEDLEKKEQRVAILQARISEHDQAMAELEQTASKQMHGLAEQSSQALETLQRKLALVESQLHQFHTFTEALANHLAQDVQDAKARLRRKKKSEKEGNRMSKCSLVKAASILNMTETDLVDMLDTDECEEAFLGRGPDTDWAEHVQHILQQQIPSAGLLMDAMLVKMKEGKVLTEELAALTAAVSKNA
ncbi:centlein isoform X1 [Labeo rohita]|uniref:Centlein isoform X1 n=1 Tax=Labeo rohita TaxID=84645 RepID=A0A498NXC6_LABRO|nr:centlein isoform X1 [Labeo rohita]